MVDRNWLPQHLGRWWWQPACLCVCVCLPYPCLPYQDQIHISESIISIIYSAYLIRWSLASTQTYTRISLSLFCTLLYTFIETLTCADLCTDIYKHMIKNHHSGKGTELLHCYVVCWSVNRLINSFSYGRY